MKLIVYFRRPYVYILSKVSLTIYQILLLKGYTFGLIVETLDFYLSFSGNIIYCLVDICTKSWDSQIVGYFATSLAICSMIVVSLYILTLLSSIVSNKKSERKSRSPVLKFDSSYNKGEKIAESIAAYLSMKKQLS